MAMDAADALGVAVGQLARQAARNVSSNARRRSNGPLSGPKGIAAGGIAAGAGLAALVPLVKKGATKLAGGLSAEAGHPIQAAGAKIGDKVSGAAKGAAKDALPDLGGLAGGKSQGVPGVGKGRRMPVQQDIDIGVPIENVYNQWTQFEEWPKFMHRVQRVTQDDESHVSFKAKVWGISKEFKAEIVEQRPDERIKWRVTEGVTHTGVVTFHPLAPRLTRVEISLDVEPGSLLEKAARGMRHIKRAVRADLARFKAYVLMQEEETGAWRGVIEEGDVKRKQPTRSNRSAGSRSASSSRSRNASSSRSRNGSPSGSRSSSSASRARGSSNESSGSSQSSSARRSGRSRASSNGRSGSSGAGSSRSNRSRSGSRS